MAASFLIPDHSTHITGARRPALVALDGGRSDAALRRRRMYRQRRIAVAVVALALVVATVVVVSPSGPSTVSPTAAVAATHSGTYEVAAGDTLWSIAARLDPDADRRQVVALLADANGGSTAVWPGQHLVVPAEVTDLAG